MNTKSEENPFRHQDANPGQAGGRQFVKIEVQSRNMRLGVVVQSKCNDSGNGKHRTQAPHLQGDMKHHLHGGAELHIVTVRRAVVGSGEAPVGK